MSRPHDIDRFDWYTREAQERIKELKGRLHRLIVQGCPTRSVDDILRHMEKALRQMQEQRRSAR